jgi:hypothetical protein
MQPIFPNINLNVMLHIPFFEAVPQNIYQTWDGYSMTYFERKILYHTIRNLNVSLLSVQSIPIIPLSLSPTQSF